ncbi:MAG: hypothetical protein HQK70_11110 [Desulfamplus sp.]|nr:hypothetical protein [Desulfamplus sp.]
MKRLSILIALSFMFSAFTATIAYSANLFIDPASPLVQVGGEITLTVTNPIGEAKWSAFEGEIEKTGNSVIYKAPDRVAIDAVTAKDSAGNIGTVAVVVQEKEKIDERFSKENANWEVFTNTTEIGKILLSDDKKILWVGTTGGLEERDAITGLRKRLLTKHDGLHNNNVNSIKPDGAGGIWVFTAPNIELEQDAEAGIVNISSDGDLKIYDNFESAGLSDYFFRDEYPDGNGGFWYITDNGLKHILSDGSEIIYDTANLNLPDNRIWSLEPDVNGCVWLGTRIGLVLLSSDGDFDIYDTTNSKLSSNFITSIELDGIGGLWVGIHGGGLAYLSSNGDWKNYDDNRSELPNNNIRSLEPDGNGGIWIGAWGEGLAHFKKDGSWQVFNKENLELPTNNVTLFLSDGYEGIWIGTYSAGLIHIESNGNKKIYDINNSDLPSNQIHALESDGNRGLWIGTDAGLAHLSSNGRWKIYSWLDDWLSSLFDDTTIAELPSDNITSLKSDNSGGIWVGTDEGLAHLLSDQSWKIYDTSNSGLTSNYIDELESDGRGGVWFTTGMDSGFAHLSSEGSYKEYCEDNSDLPSDRVNALKSDNSGGVWIGTGFGGLAHMLSNGKWEFYNTDNSTLSGNYIECLESDQSGGLWVGTGFSGLAHLTFSSGQIQDEQYLKNGRAAIIIAGGGNTDDNALWDSTAKISNYTYKMLNKRGFLNTDIHYISPQPFADFNGDGLDDKIVDSPNPARQLQLSDIQAAFDWAKTKGALNQPLYIFFTDHGGNEQLQLAKGVYIEASELKTMLDDYQKTTGNKVVFVIDACHSGTMVKALAGGNRAVISSTDDGLAYFDRTEDQSFTYFMINALFKGMDFVEAFHDAASRQKKLLGRLSDYQKVCGCF